MTKTKRWKAEALKTGRGWEVQAPSPVASTSAFLADLQGEPQATLAGFDFPIGLPAAFGRQTGFADVRQALDHFGTDAWSEFFIVSATPEPVSLRRPFFPARSAKGTRQRSLLDGLGVHHVDALRRQCEKAHETRRAACPLFWTLGGNEVGRAAISGWTEIVKPARRRHALLWPFDGELAALATAGTLVIGETYPAEAYGHVEARFTRTGGKRSQQGRRSAASSLAARCERHGIFLADDMQKLILDGFGSREDGEDPFDAALGLLGMIEVVDGRRPAIPAATLAPEWEGWILGQTSSAVS